MLEGLDIQHELAQRPLQPRQPALEDHEARAAHAGGGLEIHQAKGLAEIGVVAGGLDGEGFAPAPDLDIPGLIGALRHVRRGQVWQAGQEVPQGLVRGLLSFGVTGGLSLQDLDLCQEPRGLGCIAGSLGLANPPGEVITPGLRRFGGGSGGADLLVQQQRLRRGSRPTLRRPGHLVKVGSVAKGSDVMHGGRVQGLADFSSPRRRGRQPSHGRIQAIASSSISRRRRNSITRTHQMETS